MSSVVKITFAFAAIAAAACVPPATSDCFTLEAFATNGTRFGFLDVNQWFITSETVYGGVVNDSSQATKLGINTSTGALLDLNPDAPVSIGHHGRIASVDLLGTRSDFLWFKTVEDQEAEQRVSLICELSDSNRLSCTHPSISTYNVFGYYPANSGRTDDWPALRIGTSVDKDCLDVVVIATAAQGCAV